MLHRFDLDTLTCGVDGTSALLTTAYQILPVLILEDGVERELVAGDTLQFILQAPGVRDGTGLTLGGLGTSATPRNDDDDRYLVPVDAFTEEACALLQIADAITLNDVVSKDCDACWIFTPTGGDPIQSLPFTVKLISAVYLPTMGLPTAVPGPIEWMETNRTAVLAALGIVVTNDELQITCPDAEVRAAPLYNA